MDGCGRCWWVRWWGWQGNCFRIQNGMTHCIDRTDVAVPGCFSLVLVDTVVTNNDDHNYSEMGQSMHKEVKGRIELAAYAVSYSQSPAARCSNRKC